MYDLRHRDACDPPLRKCGPESFDRQRHTVLGLLANRSSPLMFDNVSESPFFNYVDRRGTTHQVWFDNALSLRKKYNLARQAGLRGVGSWRSDDVDYGSASAAECSRGLWAAMDGGGDEVEGRRGAEQREAEVYGGDGGRIRSLAVCPLQG